MKTIYKYQLSIEDTQEVTMPYNSKILCFQMQKEIPTIWAEVDLECKEIFPDVSREFLIIGTGHEIPQGNLNYIGTVQEDGWTLVWHLYEKLP